MAKRDEFIIEYLKAVEAFKVDLKYYTSFVKRKFYRRKFYKELEKRIFMLKNHLNSIDVYKAYNLDKNFNSTIIKWTADLNFLTSACLRYEICIRFLYKNVDRINKLLCNYFE